VTITCPMPRPRPAASRAATQMHGFQLTRALPDRPVAAHSQARARGPDRLEGIMQADPYEYAQIRNELGNTHPRSAFDHGAGGQLIRAIGRDSQELTHPLASHRPRTPDTRQPCRVSGARWWPSAL
jgi:hypothetical protein